MPFIWHNILGIHKDANQSKYVRLTAPGPDEFCGATRNAFMKCLQGTAAFEKTQNEEACFYDYGCHAQRDALLQCKQKIFVGEPRVSQNRRVQQMTPADLMR